MCDICEETNDVRLVTYSGATFSLERERLYRNLLIVAVWEAYYSLEDILFPKGPPSAVRSVFRVSRTFLE